jgi:Flp pilus assembly protein TadD
MGGPSKAPATEAGPAASSLASGKRNQQSQIDFEIEFFQTILRGYPDYVDILRILGNNLTLKGRLREGLVVDQRLVKLRPRDCLAHYNLACTFALLGRIDDALTALRQAILLGYRDFSYMKQDRDLDALRGDPRYRQLLAEFERTGKHPRSSQRR